MGFFGLDYIAICLDLAIREKGGVICAKSFLFLLGEGGGVLNGEKSSTVSPFKILIYDYYIQLDGNMCSHMEIFNISDDAIILLRYVKSLPRVLC